jgi:hypothetical protein
VVGRCDFRPDCGRYTSGSKMRALDTTPEAATIQEEAYRRLGKAGRLKIAFELSDLVRALAKAGIRKRNPEYTPEQIVAALA